jgi:hypothetical protein
MPKKLHDLMELPGQINAFASELRHFDPHVAIGDDVPSELVKKVLPGYELSLLDLWTFRRNLDDRPGYSQVLNLSALFGPVHYRPAWFPEIVRRTREHVAAELAELEQHERLHPASNHLPAAPKSVQAKPRRRVRRG